MFSSRSMDPPPKSPAKPPLITPSASPPPRPSLFSHINNSLPDVAPPLKRQRLVPTPHRAPYDTSSSSTPRPQTPADVQREREASKFRLLDVWSSLAERYNRRLDEDDIVDIRTGKITQDRGFIRNSRKVDFGAIAAPVIADATGDEGTDEDEEDDSDIDELNAFADTTDNAEQTEMGLRGSRLRQETALNAADAEDLREFLEAERRRKQLCGSDIEQEDDYSAPDIQSQDAEVEDASPADFDDSNPLLLSDAVDTSETLHSSQTALYVDSASEDELDNWEVDDSSVVYPVLKHEDNDSDIEIIDGPTPCPPPSFRPIQTVPSGRTLTQRVASVVPLSPKPSAIETGPENTPGPHLDLTQILKVKKFAMDDSVLHRSPNKRISTSKVPTPNTKPYVLLTPSKFTRLEKSKAEKKNINVDERQELDSFKDSSPRKAVEKGKAKTKTDEPFETMITTEVTASEDGRIFDTNKVKEKHRRNSSESKAYSEDPLAVVPLRVESPPQTDKRHSSSMLPPKPYSLNKRKDNQHESLREGSRSPRPSGSFSRGITVNASERQSSMSRKRKRVSSDSGTVFAAQTSIMPREEKPERHFTPRRTFFSDDPPYHENQASAFHMISEKKVVKTKSIRRSSSRSHGPRTTPKPSVSSSGSESGESSDSERGYSRKPALPHYNSFQFPHHYLYPHAYQHYTPRRKQQRHPPPREKFVPPIPDPHAQFIITQTMQQLSALVGTPWTPPHDFPSRRHQSRRANAIINTPSHRPHPHPYSYDPNLSLATLPPESPESASSPEKPSHRPRKSSMARSFSRGRRVSFKIDHDESSDSDGGRGRVDVCSSPSNTPSSRRGAVRERGRQNTTKTWEGKGKARAETPTSESGSEDPLDCGNDRDGKSYSRGRTPGPNIGPPKGMKHGKDSQGRLK